MMDAVDYATRHFCSSILNLKLEYGKSLGKDFYGSCIPIYKDDKEFHFYLYFKHKTLCLFGEKLLNIKTFDEDCLDDICKEVANQIIGYAKNLLNDRNSGKYKLGTPEFIGKVANFPIRLKESKIFKIDNQTFKIGYKNG